MKGLLNVLYRRILYKIPLKFLLILVAIIGLFFASANAYEYEVDNIVNFNGTITNAEGEHGWLTLGDINKHSNSQVCITSLFSGSMCLSSNRVKIGNFIIQPGINLATNCSESRYVFFNNVSSSPVQIEGYVASNVPDAKCDYYISVNQKSLVDRITPNGISDFLPIITGLENLFDEFIPYVFYIGIGVLGILISFVAIRWLINFIRNRILTPFKK